MEDITDQQHLETCKRVLKTISSEWNAYPYPREPSSHMIMLAKRIEYLENKLNVKHTTDCNPRSEGSST